MYQSDAKGCIGVIMSICILATIVPGTSYAGENARARAFAGWQIRGTGTLDSMNVTTGTPQLVIEAGGIQSLRGVDIGLRMIQCNGEPLAPAWQGNGTGGVNDGNWQFSVGGPGGYYPNVFSTGEPLPGMQVTSNQEYFGPSACGLETNQFGYLWLHVDGATGVVRDSTKNYGLWTIKFDLRGKALGGPVDCRGSLSDPTGPAGLYFVSCGVFPCGGEMVSGGITLFDRFGAVDHIPLYNFPAWRVPLRCVSSEDGFGCDGYSTFVHGDIWGMMKGVHH